MQEKTTKQGGFWQEAMVLCSRSKGEGMWEVRSEMRSEADPMLLDANAHF